MPEVVCSLSFLVHTNFVWFASQQLALYPLRLSTSYLLSDLKWQWRGQDKTAIPPWSTIPLHSCAIQLAPCLSLKGHQLIPGNGRQSPETDQEMFPGHRETQLHLLLYWGFHPRKKERREEERKERESNTAFWALKLFKGHQGRELRVLLFPRSLLSSL